MNATLKTITPAMAAEMLKKNTRNRPLNSLHVKRLAREMEMGRWKVNGDAIRFNGDMMNDGQHRCAAGIESGCSFESLVVEGLSSDVFSTIDAGRIRTGGDTLALLGVVNSNRVSAAIKVVKLIVTGRGANINHASFTNSEIQTLFLEYGGIEHSVQVAYLRKGFFATSVLGALHYLFAKRDKEAADKFVEDLKNGENLEAGDAVLLLRERLLQNSYMKQKLKNGYIAALAIKAWNARKAGKKVSLLKYLDTEAFPLIAD